MDVGKDYKIYTYCEFNSKCYQGLEEIINQVETENYSDFYGHFPTERLNERARHFAVAVKDDEEVIGFIRGTIIWNWIELRTLWVTTKKRKSGIGTKLIDEVKGLVFSEKLGGIYLTTWSSIGVSFYKKNGFTETHRIDDHPPGHSCYFMKWLT